jgi:hypothetical protein
MDSISVSVEGRALASGGSGDPLDDGAALAAACDAASAAAVSACDAAEAGDPVAPTVSGSEAAFADGCGTVSLVATATEGSSGGCKMFNPATSSAPAHAGASLAETGAAANNNVPAPSDGLVGSVCTATSPTFSSTAGLSLVVEIAEVVNPPALG